MKGQEFESNFNPAFNWCLIKMTPREESIPKAMKDAGLVEIPHVNQQARNKDGIVVKMGPHDCTPEYQVAHLPDFNVGDRVYYNAWAGQETPCPDGYLVILSSYLEAELTGDTVHTWI
tara:strand:+ start:335 stop:688 length:354 start_codon:yes stop_codon:yes gene_type:complete